ncbi:hypothetical protein D3C80_469870 [compost metagenome]
MAVWRGLGFAALVLLGVLVAALRTMEARHLKPVIAELHLPPAFAVARDFDFGRYRLSWRGQAFRVHPQGRPEKVLWGAAGGFLAAGRGQAEPDSLKLKANCAIGATCSVASRAWKLSSGSVRNCCSRAICAAPTAA